MADATQTMAEHILKVKGHETKEVAQDRCVQADHPIRHIDVLDVLDASFASDQASLAHSAVSMAEGP